MRILHVITTLDPNHGGPPAVALRIAAAQCASGHETAIVSYHAPGGDERIERSLASIPGVRGVKLIAVRESGFGERLLGREASRSIRGMIGGYDVLHLHGVWDTMLRVAAGEARRAGKRYAVTPHGMLDPWCLGATPAKRLKKSLALTVAYRRMLNGAAFLHVLNRDERDLMAPLGLRPPTEVVPNGVFIEEFADLPPRSRFAASRPELGGRAYLLFLSRLHPKKGLDLLVKGFAEVSAEFPDLQLVVAGPDDGVSVPLREQVQMLGVSARVHMVGPLYGGDKLAALVGAEAFCLTSRQEGFSMAVTEAMAARVAVIVSDQCHFPEVEEAGAGLITTLEPARITAAIRSVMSNEAARRAMGDAGRALVESRFTWPRIADTLTQAYVTHANRA